MMECLPENIEIEHALLGSLLVNNDTISLVRGIVNPGHFAEPLHSRIYDASCKMHDSGVDATALTLNAFKEWQLLDAAELDAIHPDQLRRLLSAKLQELVPDHIMTSVHAAESSEREGMLAWVGEA